MACGTGKPVRRKEMPNMSDSKIFHFTIGALWLVVAVVNGITVKEFVGPVYWPAVLPVVAAVFFFAWGIYLTVKERRDANEGSAGV